MIYSVYDWPHTLRMSVTLVCTHCTVAELRLLQAPFSLAESGPASAVLVRWGQSELRRNVPQGFKLRNPGVNDRSQLDNLGPSTFLLLPNQL